uniref:Uncharacterized protein n=1 Tax=Micrurus lemniscatus lemniscatus TaxID=129467 RepID=A0A2D4HSL7_MICLE
MEAMISQNTLDMSKKVRGREVLDEQGKLKTNQELKEQSIFIDWWPYLQLQNRYKKGMEEYGIYTKQQQLDKILIGPEEKCIVKMYNYLLKVALEEEVVKSCMIAWAKILGHNIDLADWEKMWNKNYTLTRSAGYKENMYKMFYRWHLPPMRLSKMYPNFNPTCWKCRQNQGTFYHM